MATKTTKRTTKTAATRTAKKTTKTGKCCTACRAKNQNGVYTFVALSLCFIITAMIATVIMVGTKLNNDALAKDIEADRNKPGATIIYVDSADDTPEQE